MGWTLAFGLSCLVCGCCIGRWLPRLPEMLLARRRHLWRLWWRWRSRSRGGRPAIDRELIDLIRRMSLENPLWGAPRIHGELTRLGFRLAQSTVSKYMVPRRRRPTQDWRTFLHNHAGAIAAIDLFGVQAGLLGYLYAVVVVSHGRRRILHVDAADRATANWLAQAVTEAFPWDEAPRFLVRDNDGAYGFSFRRRVRAMGIRDRPIPPRSPWLNGRVERLIGSIRRECLDHVMIWNLAHLRRAPTNLRRLLQQRPNPPGPGRGCTGFTRRGGPREADFAAGAGRIAPAIRAGSRGLGFSEGTTCSMSCMSQDARKP